MIKSRDRTAFFKPMLFICAFAVTFSSCKKNDPPDIPSTPSGLVGGDIGNYYFTSSATDPDSDSVSIQFDWGDGEISNWSLFAGSGDSVIMQHSYIDTGIYPIRAKAKDINEAESDWSGEHVLNISRNVLWAKTYGGAKDDFANCVQITTDGYYVIAGYTTSYGAGGEDMYLLKVDQSGNVIWEKTFGSGDDDRAYGIALTQDGGYIIVGGTYSFGSGDQDVYLVKTDGSGNQIWGQTYGGTADDMGYSVVAATDGGYVIAGVSLSFGNSQQFYLIKTNTTGDTVWTRTYGGTLLECAYSLDKTSDDGYIITGYTTSFGAGGGDVYLVKTNANGDTLWTRTIGTTAWDRGNSVEQTSDGGYIIGAGNGNVYLIKTNASGQVSWEKFFGNFSGNHDDYGYSAIQTLDGGYAIAGKTWSTVGTYSDAYVVKTDAGGTMEWQWVSNGFHIDGGNSIKQNGDGTYIIAGFWHMVSTGWYDVYLVKMKP
ncbi:MAG TPA: hypothetical protein VF399_06215 [bacterium]